MNKIGLNVGNEKMTVREAGHVVLAILGSEAEQETIRKALDTLPKLFNIGDINIGDCAINMGDCGCKDEEGIGEHEEV